MKKNNSFLLNQFGIGLLGVSGKYFPKHQEETIALLKFILNHFHSYLDTSTVYGEYKNYINNILFQCLQECNSDIVIINKVGLDLEKNKDAITSLKDDFYQTKTLFPSNKIIYLMHRATQETIERDYQFYSYLKQQDPTIIFGICTNDLMVLKSYSGIMKLDILQVAVNLLDYVAVEPLLIFAKERQIFVQARSALSSGVLSIKYDEFSCDLFQDSIRKRFSDSKKNRLIYLNRINQRNKIYDYFLKKNLDLKYSFEQFCYSILLYSPFIDSVLLGGSSLDQLQQNVCISTKYIPKNIGLEIFNQKVLEWKADFI